MGRTGSGRTGGGGGDGARKATTQTAAAKDSLSSYRTPRPTTWSPDSDGRKVNNSGQLPATPSPEYTRSATYPGKCGLSSPLHNIRLQDHAIKKNKKTSTTTSKPNKSGSAADLIKHDVIKAINKEVEKEDVPTLLSKIAEGKTERFNLWLERLPVPPINYGEDENRMEIEQNPDLEKEVAVPPKEYVIPGMPRNPSKLRPIILDGNSLAWCHGKFATYSTLGVEMCFDFFKSRGHTSIQVMVPQLNSLRIEEILGPYHMRAILNDLSRAEEDGNRRARLATPDNRKLLLQRAYQNGAVIVSNDNFQELRDDVRETWLERLDNGILKFIFQQTPEECPDEIRFQSDRKKQKKSVEELLEF